MGWNFLGSRDIRPRSELRPFGPDQRRKKWNEGENLLLSFLNTIGVVRCERATIGPRFSSPFLVFFFPVSSVFYIICPSPPPAALRPSRHFLSIYIPLPLPLGLPPQSPLPSFGSNCRLSRCFRLDLGISFALTFASGSALPTPPNHNFFHAFTFTFSFAFVITPIIFSLAPLLPTRCPYLHRCLFLYHYRDTLRHHLRRHFSLTPFT